MVVHPGYDTNGRVRPGVSIEDGAVVTAVPFEKALTELTAAVRHHLINTLESISFYNFAGDMDAAGWDDRIKAISEGSVSWPDGAPTAIWSLGFPGFQVEDDSESVEEGEPPLAVYLRTIEEGSYVARTKIGHVWDSNDYHGMIRLLAQYVCQQEGGGLTPQQVQALIAEALTAYATTAALNAGLAGKVDTVAGKGLSANDFTDAYKTLLDGQGAVDAAQDGRLNALESGQTTQDAAIDALEEKNAQQDAAIAGKVDAVAGKGLSSEDYTAADKAKLAGIDAGAEVNVLEGLTVNGAAAPISGKTAAITIVGGGGIAVTQSGGQTSIAVQDAYPPATPTSAGLMSAADKAKLDAQAGVDAAQDGRLTDLETAAEDADLRLHELAFAEATTAIHAAQLDRTLTEERFTVTLENTLEFPFNSTVNSPVSVALDKVRDNTDYSVAVDVLDHVGQVGEIEVTGREQNGFKLSFSGSGTSVTLLVKVNGGMP